MTVAQTITNGVNETKSKKTKELEAWERRRRQTFISYLFLWFCVGFESTVILDTLWSYVSHDLKTSNKKLFYGLISGGRYVSPVFIGLFVSKWFDNQRRLRLYSVLINITMAVGYVLYMIPFSPIFPFIGACMYGSSYIVRSLMTSEILRVYDENDVQAKYLMGLAAYGIGEVLGPVYIKLLENVHFSIGRINFTSGNIGALVLLGLTCVRFITTLFFVHDVSLEHDLKAEKIKLTTTASNTKYTKELNTIPVSIKIDMVFLMAHQFFATTFASGQFNLFFPLIMQTLHYSINGVHITLISSSICVVLCAYIMKLLKPSSRSVYMIGMLNLCVTIMAYTALRIIIENISQTTNIVLISIYVILYAVHWITEMLFITITVGKMSPSSTQSTFEMIRASVRLCAAMFGGFLTPFVYEYFRYCFPVLVVCCVLLVGGMVVRRKTLIDPLKREMEDVPLMSDVDK